MEKKEYLETVLEQIRFEKAKRMISDELENHIHDQKEAFMLNGMDEKEAYEKAVDEMGDPIDVGIAMDRIHRPKMEWKMILLVLGISIISILLQFVMKADMGNEIYSFDVNRQVLYVGVGLAVMIAFCFFDYTRIGLFAKAGASILILLLLLSLAVGPQIKGKSGFITFGTMYVSLHLLSYLYIPFYGGILYSYKNQGNCGFVKSILWMIIPIFLCLRLPDLSLASALLMIMLIQIVYVMSKGWFEQSKKRIILTASLIAGCPIAMILYFLFFGAEYQRDRILALFTSSHEYNYTMNTVRDLLRGSSMAGKSADGVGSILPDVASNYILTYVFSYYGILAAVILLFVLGFFIFKVFKISLRQKNQLGLVIGIGCSMVFSVQIIMYVMVNFTIIPTTSVFLPLFSYGGTGTIVSYALIGILLSIYRYENVIPANPVITNTFRTAKRLAQNS